MLLASSYHDSERINKMLPFRETRYMGSVDEYNRGNRRVDSSHVHT